MSRWFLLVIVAFSALIASAVAAPQPVPVIFDTDMGNDIDDALALALLHALQSAGECKLLAVTVTKDNPYAAPFCDLVNTFYGRGEIPIGVVRGGPTPEDSPFLRPPVTAQDNGRPRYPHVLTDGRKAPEATSLLRRVLAAQADGSVVVVQVGFSTNLARLLESKPDAASPLDGAALVKQKVRLLSAMAGCYAPGRERFKEYNVVTDVASARKVFQDWPTPIAASGFEIGEAIRYSARSIVQDYAYVPHHPVAEAYRLYMKMPYDRPTWDLTSAIHAVQPQREHFGLSPPGRVVVEPDGTTRFLPDPAGPHRYLIVRPERVARLQEAFAWLCSHRPAAVVAWEKEQAAAARKVKVRSTRTQPETRVALENPSLRLDFDPRVSDTAYNYLWFRRPGGDRWERVYNFGVDVQAHEIGDGRLINCVGMNLSLRREGNAMRVAYPLPLVQYRQFDDKIGPPELVRNYPDFSPDEQRRLVRADAAIEFSYEIDPARPSFVVSGRATKGRVASAVMILDALWTDNHRLPTHEVVDGRAEFDLARPEAAAAAREVEIEKEAFAIFYRRDGEGLPYAILPLTRHRARIVNYYDNWKCLYDFRASGLNQQFVPDDPPVTESNDTGYLASLLADGTFPPVRLVFFPELGWRQGGTGDGLLSRIVQTLKRSYLSPPGASR